LLAGYALAAPKKQASGIVEALESARYRAKRAGRSAVTFDDIKAAVTIDHLGATGGDSGPVQRDCNDHAKPLQSPRGDRMSATDATPRDSPANFSGPPSMAARLAEPVSAET
jgi:hypothetical protein